MKKAMLLAATACVAMFALPAVASAGVWHVPKGDIGFTGSGGTLVLTPASGSSIHCTSLTYGGAYETTTTGWIKYTFHGCTGPLGASCTTPGQPTGTITTTKLTFHNVIVNEVTVDKVHKRPGRLITPSHDGHLYTYVCFGISTKVTGNGLISTLNKNCGDKAASATESFTSSAAGVPNPTQITGTGTQYTLEASTAGGSPVMASWDASGTMNFAEGAEQTIECT